MRKVLVGSVISAVAVVTVQVLGAGAVATPQTVTPTIQTINGRVNTLSLSNGRLFIGGQMTVPFNSLGAIDPASGSVVWSATGVPSQVRTMTSIGTTLFVGGDFGVQIFDETTFAHLASISCGQVKALSADPSGTGVYLGGTFTTCGGQTHKNLARIDLSTLAVSGTWAPKADNGVLSLKADSTGVFVGGSFSNLNGTARFRLGKIRSDGGLDAWNSTYVPNPNDTGTNKSVRALDYASGKLFASWGESVNKVVIYDLATATFIQYWGTDGDTQAELADGGNIYLGGHWYQFVGPSPSVHFAAFDATTLQKEAVVDPIPYSPMGVFAIVSDGAGGLWLGGDVTGKWGPQAVKVVRLVHLTPGGGGGGTTTTTTGSTTTTTGSTTTIPTTTTIATTTTTGGVDTTPPTGSITSPTNGSTVSGTITVQATASDNVGVTQVNVRVDGVFVATLTKAPYQYALNTASYANGNHTLDLKIYDAAGNKATSAPVTINVQN